MHLCAIGNSGGSQVFLGSSLKTVYVGAVRRHYAVQGGTAGFEAALFRFVFAGYESHELGHAVPVVVRGPEGVLLDRPSRGEDHEVRYRRAFRFRRAG